MTLPFQIGGARVVIPGVYDTLRVQSSLPAPVPAGRSVLILGESEEGIPGKDLDLRLNYFTDFQSVKDFYTSGPIVDAARMLFTAQPSPSFGGAIQRLFVYKTNATTRAGKALAANYGTIYAARYGESGNLIKSQVKALSEVLPSKTFSMLPVAGALSMKAGADGVVAAVTLAAPNVSTGAGCGPELSTKLAAVTGLACPAVTMKVAVAVPMTIDTLSASGDVLTLTTTLGSFGTAVVAGDTVVIPADTVLAGPADQNAGVYVVESWSNLSVSLRQVKHFEMVALVQTEVAAVPFYVTGPIAAVDSTMLGAFGPLTVSVDASTVVGSAAVMELGSEILNSPACSMVDMAAMSPIVSAAGAALGSVSAVASGSELTVTIANASWVTVPKMGDVVSIGRASALAGAALANVGLYVVKAASAQSLVLSRSVSIACASVASASIASVDVLQSASGFVSSSVAARRVDSASEAKVWVEAVNVQTGVAFPTTPIGGTVYLEIGTSDGPATVEIDSLRNMTVTTGSGVVAIRLGKYKSLQNLVDFLGTQAGIVARVPDARHKSLPTSVLDAVLPVSIEGITATSLAGKLKGDYYSFQKFLADNFGLISFAAGTARKAGLPAAEVAASFLSGAVVGGTTDADVQAGLDESLKISVRMVVPLMSRDALKDVEDGLTDSTSNYQIDSIHAMVKNHVATASGIKVKRERFGCISVHDSFQNSIDKCSAMSYERLQMTFEMVRAVDGQGALQWFQPWMSSCAVAAGRAQATLGTSMLRKTFAFSAVKHIGAESVYSDTLAQDFDPEDQGQLETAIEAGLMVFRAVQGFGVRVESPDLSTRSRENDPEGWVWERHNVLFTLDEVRQTTRNTLENYIGSRQSDVSLAVVKEAINKVMLPFISGGSLITAVVDKVVREGVGYRAFVRVVPAECLEFIALEVLAERAV